VLARGMHLKLSIGVITMSAIDKDEFKEYFSKMKENILKKETKEVPNDCYGFWNEFDWESWSNWENWSNKDDMDEDIVPEPTILPPSIKV